MAAKQWIVIGTACLVVSGCAHHHRHRMAPHGGAESFKTCRGAVCNVKVSVSDACEIEVDPEGLLILRRSGDQEFRKHDIHWDLQGNYKFAANGIEFINTPPDVMKCSRQNDKHWTCDNAHTAGAYKYWVRVEGKCSNGQEVPPRDPFVMND